MKTATLCYTEPIIAEAILWDGTNFEEIEKWLDEIVNDPCTTAELDEESPKVLHVYGPLGGHLTLYPGIYLCHAFHTTTESFPEMFLVPKDEVEDGTWELGVQS